MKHKEKCLALLVLGVLALPLLAGFRPAEASGGILEDMNTPQTIIAVETGTIAESEIKTLLPEAHYVYINTPSDGYVSVQTGKADAFAGDLAIFNCALREGLTGLKALDEQIGEDGKVAVGISPVSQIPDLENMINKFLADMQAQGVLDDMYQRWVIDGNYTMPEIAAAKDPSTTVKIGTTGLLEPYTFYSGSELTGYEMEMMRRFALWANVRIEVLTYDWAGIIAACTAGKVDCIMSNLYDTDERDSIGFSNPYIRVKSALIVRAPAQQASSAPAVPEGMTFASAQALSEAKARMGVRTGSIQDAYTKQYIPNASILYFDDVSDMIVALNSGKIDAFMTTTLRVPFILRDNANLASFELKGPLDQLAVMVARTEFGGELLPKINQFIAASRESGLFQQMYDAWFHAEDSYPEIISPPDLPRTNGVIRYAAQAGNEPVSLMKGMEMVGFEMDILTRFCKEYGYGLEVTELNIPGILAGITSGKYDMAGGGLAITEERRQSTDFTDSYYSLGQCIIVRAASAVAASSAAAGAPSGHPLEAFWQGFQMSVEKNFIREGRWRLIVNGIGVTLTISIFSALFGTLFGFGLCMLRLRGRKAVSGSIKAFVRIIQGVPLVVLLMVLYYVVFGSVDINAILVAIIGLSVNFGVYVSEMMRTGIEAVDRGQIEAALALGYSRIRTFWKITFPQAARHFLPVYKGEFISMVKMTSIVGYIAIMDLTKASDIIRSRTYEAFFPLIVTAVIYFLLAWSLTSLLNLLEIRIDPKRRSRKLKGVTER